MSSARPAPGPPTTPARDKILTPALLAALTGLAVLAAITFVVVVFGAPTGGQSTTANSETSSIASPNPVPSESTAISSTPPKTSASASTTSSQDNTFTFAIPASFDNTIKQVQTQAIVHLTHSDNQSTLVVTSTATTGSLSKATQQARAAVEQAYETTTEPIDTDGAQIDGEDTEGFRTGSYDQSGTSMMSAAILTIHDGTVYLFVTNSTSAKLDRDVESLQDLVASVTWSN